MSNVASSLSKAEMTSTNGSTETMLSIVAPSNHRVRLKRLFVGAQGTSTTEKPMVVTLYRKTGGTLTMAGSITPVKDNSGDNETLQVTGSYGPATVEPTKEVMRRWTLHPQSNLQIPFPEGLPIIGGETWGVDVKNATGASQSITATAEVEE